MTDSAERLALETWAKGEKILLWPDGVPGGAFAAQALPSGWPQTQLRNIAQPYMRLFRPERANGRSLLIIPGGAYTFVSIANEGVDIARSMTAEGYTVFVLVHRLPSEGWGQPSEVALQDARCALALIGEMSATLGTDVTQVHVIGFSAGGHLAASLATRPGDGATDTPSLSSMGLIYPVISHEKQIGNALSTQSLLGDNPSESMVALHSPAGHVSANTPPGFFVHALDDADVPSENSLVMIRAMQAAGRPAELHLFEEGGHGFGLGPPHLPVRQWLGLYCDWLDRKNTKPESAA
ncbi:alpha/beta hydrolase [Hyphomonas oceanitis]|uniref:Putative xylanase n=1 Tax=Hyphomonas oceanitis SCH89 TaxID=1280953 RepID=A0A059G203_9PROT|nr:alpha/beta hydrolase [Hyphomonas oceanitis]KDA00836.1 putative xylanase [Hyphomonas oceanitis SCH89]